jgi:hypothetical protein
MSRAFSINDTVVVKPSDIGNCMGDVVLDHDPRSKTILLSVPLRTFILSVLKSAPRRDWTRARAKFWRPLMAEFPVLASVELNTLNDAQKSADLWLITNAFWIQLRNKVSPERVLPLDGEQISRSPVAALTKVLSFFEIPMEPTDITRIASGEAASKHSKRPGSKYDAATRQADLLGWEERYGNEADRAIEWACLLAEELQLGRVDGAVAGIAPEQTLSESL